MIFSFTSSLFSLIVFLSALLFLLLNRFLLMLYLLCQSKSCGACHFSLDLLIELLYSILWYQLLDFLSISLWVCLWTTNTTFSHRSDLLTGPDGDDKRPPTPFQRSVGVQTDYRESETQTDSYTPDHLVRPGTASPELLTLATLTWGKSHKYNYSHIYLMHYIDTFIWCII